MSANKHKITVTQEEYEDLMHNRSNRSEVPILKQRSEDRIRREVREVALRGCIGEIEEFAKCAHGKVFSVLWKCRSLNRAVDKCMKKIGNDESLKDEIRRRHAAKYPKSVLGMREASGGGGRPES